MLDARYVHLHEALGLGEMWLKNHAKIMATSPATIDETTAAASQMAHSVASASSHQSPSVSSRLAVLQAVNANHAPTRTVSSLVPAFEYHVAPLGDIHSARVMVMSMCASPADVMTGRLFSGADGELLWKMLAAIHLSADDVYISTWLKDLPDFNPMPSAEAVRAASDRVRAEWQACPAKVCLLMGDFFERDDVRTEMAQMLGDRAVFIIPHPQRILENTSLKRGVWATLQQLAQSLAVA